MTSARAEFWRKACTSESDSVGDMSVNLVPRDQIHIAAALDTLALNFNLRQDVVNKLNEGLQDLEELRLFFDHEEHVGAG